MVTSTTTTALTTSWWGADCSYNGYDCSYYGYNCSYYNCYYQPPQTPCYPGYPSGCNPSYTVTFQEGGLPLGASWGLNVGANYFSTSDETITVYGLTGTVNYAYQTPLSNYYCQSNCAGSVSGASSITSYYIGSIVNQNVTITTTTDVPEFQDAIPVLLMITALAIIIVRRKIES